MKIIKNYLYNVFYQVFVLLVPLITMPYIARVLGPTGVGINSFTNSNTQYFILIGSIGVSLYGNRQIAYHRDNQEEASQIFWEVFLMRMLTILVALVAFFIFLGVEKSYHYAYLMQSILIMAAAFDISWFFMGFENFKVTVLRNIIVKLISLACIFIFVRNKGDLTLYIAVLSISQLIGNITLFPYLKRYINLPNWRELKIGRHFKPSLVLFVPQIATQVYLILNKTMVGKMVSVEAAGFYDNSDKIVKMAAVGRLMFFVSIVFLLFALCIVLGVQYLMPTGHNKEFTISVTIGAVVNIILNVPMILWLGTQGAMIATVISEISVTAYQFYVVRYELSIRQMMAEVWKYFLGGLMMFAVVLYLNLTVPFNMVQLGLQIGIGILVYAVVLWLTKPKLLKYIHK